MLIVKVSLPSKDAPAIRPLLLSQLQAAISLYRETVNLAQHQIAALERLRLEAIPLHRVQNDQQVLYKSAIAFKLAAVCQLPAMEIGAQIVTCLPTLSHNPGNQPILDFTVEAVTPGWIYFYLSDRTLATWLQHLISFASPYHRVSPSPSSILFPVQYAHARCCSLLRLAHQEGMIKLNNCPTNTVANLPIVCLVEPNPIPWLNAESQLYLVHPAERQLIAQLLELLDELSNSRQPNWVKLATTLSNDFESFYKHCRIWGEVKAQTPQLAQARLGLVALMQSFFRLILEDRLGILAPTEL